MRPGQNKLKKLLQDDQIAFGVAFHLRDPAIVEMIGLGGLDAVFIDMENYGLDLSAVEDLIRAAEIVGLTPIVRVPKLDSAMIRHVLDFGAHAVTVPNVTTRQEAEEAVRAARYRPAGERGASPVSRASRYGADPWEAHKKAASDEIVLSVGVESKAGLEELENIAAVPGVDIVAIGPSDLAEGLGVTEPNDPRLREVVGQIAERVKKVGNAKLGFPYGHRMIDVTYEDLRGWGVGYANVGPLVERVLLNHFRAQMAILKGAAGRTD
jgi:2-keto-3-deoxy-L-rhamnonate aldolase RhmA